MPSVRRLEVTAAFDLARKSDRLVWGYDSRTGRGGTVNDPAKWPEDWDRVCVEGDSTWTLIKKGDPK